MVAHVMWVLLALQRHNTQALQARKTKTERCYAPKKPFRDIESLVSEVWWQLAMRGVALCLP